MQEFGYYIFLKHVKTKEITVKLLINKDNNLNFTYLQGQITEKQ